MSSSRTGTIDELVDAAWNHPAVRGAIASPQGRTAQKSPTDAERTLLADWFACVRAGEKAAPTGWTADGTSGVAATLALRSHAFDLDDIHWGTGTHIGSVVWPVALALGIERESSGSAVTGAARLGYQVTADLAQHLGPRHAQTWHVTATAGVVGAAATAATLLGLDRTGVSRACGHAAAMAGGTGQAIVERSATTGFHRAAAAVIGIQAARLAQSGIKPSIGVIDGPRGMAALLAGGEWSDVGTDRRPAIEETALRLFPTNGFAQAAVALTAQIASGLYDTPHRSELQELVVEVPAVVAAATTGEIGGHWWDLRGAVAAAWCSRDPFRLRPTAASRALRPAVRVVTVAATPSTTRVTAVTRTPVVRATENPVGRLEDPGLIGLLRRKWSWLAEIAPDTHPQDAPDVLEAAEQVLDHGPRAEQLSAVLTPRQRTASAHSSPKG